MINATTPVHLLHLLAGEVKHHAGTAAHLGLSLMQQGLETDALWRTADLFVHSAATVAAVFTPLPSRRKRLQAAFPDRGRDLAAMFDIDQSDLAGVKELRDSFVHIDERYEEFWMDEPTHNLAIRNVGPAEMFQMSGQRFHHWDDTRNLLTFGGAEVDVAKTVTVMGLLLQRAPGVEQELWESIGRSPR